MHRKACTDTLLMVRPAHFGYNPDTAASNAFQHQGSNSPEITAQKAQEEFDQCVALLRQNGVNVHVVQDSDQPVKTDAVFPNNWFSTHPSGKIVLYPMLSPNRRLERTSAVIDKLKSFYTQPDVIDFFSGREAQGMYLEGTGSMVLDRSHRIAYACRSARTHPELVKAWGQLTGYQMVLFDAVDGHGQAIYHTNVMMGVGANFAVVCLDSIPDLVQRNQVTESLVSTQHEIVEITSDQVNAFAGNMLHLKNTQGESLLAMSRRAYDSLTAAQIQQLETFARILSFPLDVIEECGGGSIRCMMAEIFL
ncbi:MAG: arginine deiminase-related protein [Bacteroidota bacterium]